MNLVLPENPMDGSGAYFRTPSGAVVMFLYVGHRWVYWVNGQLTEQEDMELDAIMALEET